MGYTAIVDYGVGNLKSVANALAYLGQRTVVTGEAQGLERADAKTIPIIAMTADAFAEDIKKCLDCGMNAHVAKPIDVPVLLGTIRGLLR